MPYKNREDRLAYVRRWQQTEVGRACHRRAQIAHYKRHISLIREIQQTPEFRLKQRAYQAVQRAIHKGVLIHGPCVRCGATKVRAHHPFGYEGTNALIVEWLCASCHRQVHQ